MLTVGVDPTFTNKQGENALHIATKSKQSNILKALLKTEININAQTNNKKTAMYYAISQQWKDGFNLLLRKKPNTQLKDALGLTVLALAAKNGFEYALKKLPINASLIDQKSNNKDTPLLLATSNGCVPCVRFLLSKRADINQQNKQGESALTLSIKHSHLGLSLIHISEPTRPY